MDTTHMLIGALFIIMLVGLSLNNSRYKEQIEKMQKQIDELCKATGHRELISTQVSDDEKK